MAARSRASYRPWAPKCDVFRRGDEPCVGHGSRVTGESIAARCEAKRVGELVADKADSVVPEPEQVFGRKLATALIVAEDAREPGRVLVCVDEDDRDVSSLEPWNHVFGRGEGDDEQAISPLAKGQGLEVLVALLDRLDVVDDEIELTIRESGVDTAESLSCLRSRQERGDDCDRLGLSQTESSCREAGGEVEFPGRLDDPLLRLLIDQRTSVEGS